MSDDNNDFWTAWQLLDPLLPTGGFAHSNGLEAATQFGFIDTGNGHGVDVSTLFRTRRNACSTLAPFVLAQKTGSIHHPRSKEERESRTSRRGQRKRDSSRHAHRERTGSSGVFIHGYGALSSRCRCVFGRLLEYFAKVKGA